MKRRVWTRDEEELLQELWAGDELFAKDIAVIFSRPVLQIYQKAARMGIRRQVEVFAKKGGKVGSQSEKAKEHQFPKGHTPANKGQKMPPETYSKVSRTMFPKGHTPKNHREIGSERTNVDGYIEIKVAEPNKWKLKHRIIWEDAYGPIEKGYNIQFKDGNPQNVTLENLYIISRRQQLTEQNSLVARYPKELQNVIRIRAAIKRQITLHYKHKGNSNE